MAGFADATNYARPFRRTDVTAHEGNEAADVTGDNSEHAIKACTRQE